MRPILTGTSSPEHQMSDAIVITLKPLHKRIPSFHHLLDTFEKRAMCLSIVSLY